MVTSINFPSYVGVELRKLPPRFRLKLSQLLDVQEGWKKLMSHIPSETEPSVGKYTAEHLNLVEAHGLRTGKLCGEILLDEWSTSGRSRPRVETLLELLIQCQLFRAADYVALEILGDEGAPTRPNMGPAAPVISLTEDFNGLQVPGCIGDDGGNYEGTTSGSSTMAMRRIRKYSNDNDGYTELLERLRNHDYERENLPFSIKVIEKVTKGFKEEFCIGNGAFGTVYRLDLSPNGGPVLAVKLLNPTASCVEDQFLTEVRVLSEFRHPNLVPLIGYCTNGPKYCLIYEYLAKGSLLDALAGQNPVVRWTPRVLILVGVAKGLEFLHTAKERPLIHRDIKSANVLLDSNLLPKIGDFGLAKSFSSSNQTSAMTSTIFGTSAYMAPEAFRGDISPKMDIFSFGVIFLEILTGLSPYDENREGNDIVTFVQETLQDDDISSLLDTRISEEIDPTEAQAVYELGLKCLEEKKRRPTILPVSQALDNISKRIRGAL